MDYCPEKGPSLPIQGAVALRLEDEAVDFRIQGRGLGLVEQGNRFWCALSAVK